MTDLLGQAASWLASMRSKHMSCTVTYRRGQTELALSATFGRPDREVEDDLGIRVGETMIDFLIAATDFEPTVGEPEPGDQIVADGRVYEVLDLAGQGHWRWSGTPGTTMRIHTKQIGTE